MKKFSLLAVVLVLTVFVAACSMEGTLAGSTANAQPNIAPVDEPPAETVEEPPIETVQEPPVEAVEDDVAPEPDEATGDVSESAPPSGNYGEITELELDDDTKAIVFGSDEVSFCVTSTLLIRNGNGLLLDTKFNKTDAQEIINYINDNGVQLTQIFITHGDPDYYFGLEEIKATYPDVIARTTPSVAQHITNTVLNKLVVWADALGDEVPQNIVLPQAFEGTEFEFEGLAVQIFGSDPSRITLYIPDLSLLVGGANITTGNHLFLADMSPAEDRARWMNNLMELRDVNAETVIPGHSNIAEESFTSDDINFSISYLEAVEEVLPTVENSEQFIAAMGERFPNLLSEPVLGLSAQVLTGEMTWE